MALGPMTDSTDNPRNGQKLQRLGLIQKGTLTKKLLRVPIGRPNSTFQGCCMKFGV